MRIKCRILAITLFALFVCATCFGQTTYRGLTPGQSTRAEVEQVLGQPTGQEGERLFAYSKGGKEIYVQYSKHSPAAIRIEVIYSPPGERAEVLLAEGLPKVADARRTNKDGLLEEYFGDPKYMVLTYEKNSQTKIEQVGYFSRELFENLAPEMPKSSSSTGRAGWGPIQQATTSEDDAKLLTYYRGTTPEQCQADCDKNPQCVAFTLIKAGAYNPNDPPMCYLLSEARKLTPSSCCISAVKKQKQ